MESGTMVWLKERLLEKDENVKKTLKKKEANGTSKSSYQTDHWMSYSLNTFEKTTIALKEKGR